MQIIRLSLESGPCEIQVGRNILSRRAGAPLAKNRDQVKAFIFVDRRLVALGRQLSGALCKGGWIPQMFPITAGEPLKEMKRLLPLYGSLLSKGADRESVIFALGGGSLGDAIGFIAGTYMRGVSWVNVPTTLLAQVDSAIGGKTAVNHSMGKNLIGVFHQPARVICDTSLLKSLSIRDRISGLGEMMKYALILDRKFFDMLQRDWRRILALEAGPTEKAIAHCAALKARVVEKDERDVAGAREDLNFGHTVGHALEKVAGYGKLRHGEAVLWGMRAALALSTIRGHLSDAERERAESVLRLIRVPSLPRRLDLEAVLAATHFDKKKQAGRVRFVLLKKIGQTVADSGVSVPELRRALEDTFR
ncbi:MAG: 3-dehydroquinate synthase [Bdellovibrionales bacterium GWB1_52_6]|nr:MAG: 3-dehydroquinate synthase [Bdellovibrionales bacterium GWB1_52_6]OFZ04744.1 MAG: 3-dehydroquinate synthase [Bdellovibrionales bacterium GWA1_52_35]HCM39557.1 3-dehydroquinate synthase [Bdellovibrionales bacterium]